MNNIHPDNQFPVGWTEIDKDLFARLITCNIIQRNSVR